MRGVGWHERCRTAPEAAHGRELPAFRGPDERLDEQRARLSGIDVEAARLAAAARPGLAEAGRDRDDHAAFVPRDDLELVALADRGLVDVAAEDELRARVDQAREDVRAARDGPLPGAPGRSDHLMVEHDDPECTRGRLP